MINISPKKKILLAVPLPPPFAGPEVSSQLMINSFLKDEFDLLVLRTTVHKTNAQRGKVSAGSIGKLIVLLLKLFGMIVTQWPDSIYTIINQNKTGFVRDSCIVLVSKLFGRRVILHFRGSNFEAFYKTQSHFFKTYIRFILNRADKIILQAEWVKEKFAQFVPRPRLCVIYNAVPTAQFEGLLQTRSAHNGEVKVLFLNHLSVAKGFVDLLEAAKTAVRENSNIHFLIAGDVINEEKNILFGEDGKKMEFMDIHSLVEGVKKDKSLDGRIQFLGEVLEDQSKMDLYRTSDMFVLPSYSEGCPLSVLEAMASGLPVVVTPVGALVEIIKDKHNGFIVPLSNPQGLKEKLLTLASDNQLRRSIGESNQKLMKDKFDLKVILRQIANVFNEASQ
jgi:glycosyltransferase involved in cell wall biosynthesis